MSDGVYFGLWLFVPTLIVCVIAICIQHTKRPPEWHQKPWNDPRSSLNQFRNIVDTNTKREAR